MSKFLSYLKANPTFREQKNGSEIQNPVLTQGSWTRTTLEVRDQGIRPGLRDNSFSLTLRLEELDESLDNSGKNQNSGPNQLQLTLEVEGKELALFSGLIGRRLYCLGYSPGVLLSHGELWQRNQELESQLQELLFQLEQVREALGIEQSPKLRLTGS